MLSDKAKDLILNLAHEAGEKGTTEEIVQRFLDAHDPELIEEAAKPGAEEELNELRRACGLPLFRGKAPPK
jgi:hypothetical protein